MSGMQLDISVRLIPQVIISWKKLLLKKRKKNMED